MVGVSRAAGNPARKIPFSGRFRRVAHAIAACGALAIAGCLAGAGSAIGGGPIGMAPDPRDAALLPEADSTRGQGFILASNRRDLMDETRVELNGSARAFERLLGERPVPAQIRMVSTDTMTTLSIRVGDRVLAPFDVPVSRRGRGRDGVRGSDALRVASRVISVMSREWLTEYLRSQDPEAAVGVGRGWMQETRIAPWLRVGMLQAVAESRVHETWLMRLGRMRDSLEPISKTMSNDACPAACLAPFSPAEGAAGGAAPWMVEGELPGRDAMMRGGRGQPPSLDGRMRFVASAYALTLFFSRREGPTFVRAMITASLDGRDAASVFGTARTFTPAIDDIDRQWRVWLATYAYGPGRQPPI